MSHTFAPSWNPCQVFGNATRESNESKSFNNPENNVSDITSHRVKTLAKALPTELKKVKATWKSLLPALSAEDVRRYRIPYHEVVDVELKEAGYDDAARYIKMLITLDEELRNQAGPGTVIWTNPWLKDRSDFVDRLKFGLVEANRAMLSDERVAQAIALLETALYFQEKTWEWWWVAEQLFRSALTVGESIKDDSQTVTTIKYLYGRFLLNEMKDADGSLKFLEEAREASHDKAWNASKILGIKQNSLFRECCALLYRVFLSLAKKGHEDHANIAVKACQKALKHAMDSGHDEYITDATCELGRSYLRAKEAKLALQNFIKYLNLSRKALDYEGICNAHMELASAYKELGDVANTMEQLELFRETASRFQLPSKLAQAHYHIGKHLLSRNYLPEATSHLEFTFSLYNDLGQSAEAHQARCFAAVSKGQEYIDQYIEQLLKCEKNDESATLRLCAWKNIRAPFWLAKKDAIEMIGEVAGDNSGEFNVSDRQSRDNDINTKSTSDSSGIIRSPEPIISVLSENLVAYDTTVNPDYIKENNTVLLL